MKKKTFIIVSCISVPLIGLAAFITYGFLTSEPAGLTTDEQNIIILNENKANILCYGEEVGFSEDLVFTSIDEISEASSFPQSYNNFLIVNNLNGSIDMDSFDFAQARSLVLDKKFTFFYIGDIDDQLFIQNGLLEEEITYNGTIGFYTGYSDAMLFYGCSFLYSTELSALRQYDALLGSGIADSMVRLLKSNYEMA